MELKREGDIAGFMTDCLLISLPAARNPFAEEASVVSRR